MAQGYASYTLFVLIAPLAALVSVAIAVQAWRKRSTPIARALAVQMTIVSIWLVTNSTELLTPDEGLTLFLAKLDYPLMHATALAWLAVTLVYTGYQRWLSPGRFAWLCIIPALTTLAAFTNEWHHLIWQDLTFVEYGGMLAFRALKYGVGFWIAGVYLYAVIIIGALLVLRTFLQGFRLYQHQSIWLVVGGLTPLIVNFPFVFRLIRGFEKDYSPLAFALAGMAFAVGIFRYRLFDLRPIARSRLIDILGDSMLVLDEDNRVVDFNPAAQAILGLPADQIIGRPGVEVLRAWPDLVERFRNQADAQAEIALTRDGATRHFDLRISTLKDQRGRALGRLITTRDVTDRKQAEEEREKLIEELDAYAHTVAHDLKSPMSTVIAYVDMIEFLGQEHAIAAPIEKHLRSIQRTALRMSTIVDELLVLASVRRQETVKLGPLDTAALVSSARLRLSHMIEEVKPEIKLPETWPAAQGYGPWIEEVWVNYLSNALKYGGQPLRIELGAEPCPDGSIRFWVQDNGRGLTPEEQATLFTPFTRLGQANTKGYGLGLSIVQRIVAKLGGQVGVESRLGHGSKFYFTLPAAPPSEPAPAKPAAVTAA